MLPLVRTTSTSFSEQQPLPPHTLLRQRMGANAPAQEAVVSLSNALSGGRSNALALSAQVQLAQGTSVFAETVGRLIKLPRREGETLSDYTKRLFEAIKALNPAERAALERSLNQLVRGITLQLLNQVLANPAGPEAARFAVNLETAKLVEGDLAAKAAVNSYQQNEGAEPAPGMAPRVAANTPKPADAIRAGTTAPAQNAAPTAPANSGAVQAVASPSATSASAELATEAVEADEAPVPQHSSPAGETVDDLPDGANTDAAAAKAGQLAKQAVEARGTPAGGRPVPTTVTTPDAGEPAAALPASMLQSTSKQAYAAQVADPGLLLYEQAGEEWSLEPKRQEQAAAARLPEHRGEALRKTPADKASISAVAQWLAETFDEDGFPTVATAAASRNASPEQQALRALLNADQPTAEVVQARATATDGQAGMRAPSATTSENLADDVSPQATRAQQDATAMPRPVTTEVSDKMVVPMTLPPVMRDGVPLAYAPYPPEERERDPEERKTRAVSATDEDGESQQGQDGQAFHHAEEDDRQDEPEADVSEDDEETDSSSPANDLYWRMAGWA
ncbi:hypothetical protein CYG48_15710 [Neorhizobium sp. SOG26]|uniref:hypothetical protein n=1 Tax=Neorhizobium sp. SOG26 TaxID=2060726 RepID=UPI000E5712F9|nr:hypothetical protein [Neorhizobium sp. SOG26]AXV17006.1 hypothetical protein CYG48_15710 [Neorhizobium sp. SOG26]